MVIALAPIHGGEMRIDFACTARAAVDVASALSELSGDIQQIDGEAQPGLARLPVTLRLVAASPAGARQALAHALGCWWSPGSDRQIIHSRSPRLAQGGLRPDTHPSGLRNLPALEAQVEALIDPWLGGSAGVGYLAREGLWSATLDDTGHARLIEILSLMDQPAPRAPSLLPDADAPDPRTPLTGSVDESTWNELAAALARQTPLSVSLAPGLAGRRLPQRVALPLTTIGELITGLDRAGVPTAMLRGVLCIGDTMPDEREHPAVRRRLAVVPIAHLAATTAQAEAIAADLTARVDPPRWRLPGWMILALPRDRALLVAADAPTIHRVLDVLDADDSGSAGIAWPETMPRGTAPGAGGPRGADAGR